MEPTFIDGIKGKWDHIYKIAQCLAHGKNGHHIFSIPRWLAFSFDISSLDLRNTEEYIN